MLQPTSTTNNSETSRWTPSKNVKRVAGISLALTIIAGGAILALYLVGHQSGHSFLPSLKQGFHTFKIKIDGWGGKNDLTIALILYAILGTVGGVALLGALLKRKPKPETTYIVTQAIKGEKLLAKYEATSREKLKPLLKALVHSEELRRADEAELKKELEKTKKKLAQLQQQPWPGAPPASASNSDLDWAANAFN